MEPMTQDELRAWLELRGVRPAEMEQALLDNAGRTEDEMDELAEQCHGSMA